MTMTERLKSCLNAIHKSNEDVGRLLGKSRPTIIKKFREGKFTLEELDKIMNEWITDPKDRNYIKGG